jgi:hypothetical protein
MSSTAADFNRVQSTSIGASAGVTVTIADNDVVGVRMSASSLLLPEAVAAGTSYTVVLSSMPTSTVRVSPVSANNAAVVTFPLTLTFSAANWNVSQSVFVRPVNDEIAHGNRTVAVTHTVASLSAAYNGLAGSAVDAVSVTCLDDDFVGFVFTSLVQPAVAIEGGISVYSLRLGSQPLADVDVAVSVTAPGDASTGAVSVSPATVKFTSSNWNTNVRVTLVRS